MILYINTASHEKVELTIRKDEKIVARKMFRAARHQAERLLPELDKLLRLKKIKLGEIKKIIVANRGGSFTSLRIGVITANALAYALKIPVQTAEKSSQKTKKFTGCNIVEPIYDREPIVGMAKK